MSFNRLTHILYGTLLIKKCSFIYKTNENRLEINERVNFIRESIIENFRNNWKFKNRPYFVRVYPHRLLSRYLIVSNFSFRFNSYSTESSSVADREVNDFSYVILKYSLFGPYALR